MILEMAQLTLASAVEAADRALNPAEHAILDPLAVSVKESLSWGV